MQVDTEYLEKLIDSKGLKKSFIAERLGISPGSFYNKSHNVSEFTFGEALELFNVLEATTEEREKIFVKM